MKIISVDNFDRETIDDELVCENVNEQYGKVITDALNDRFSGVDGIVFFKLVEDDHTLYKFEI